MGTRKGDADSMFFKSPRICDRGDVVFVHEQGTYRPWKLSSIWDHYPTICSFRPPVCSRNEGEEFGRNGLTVRSTVTGTYRSLGKQQRVNNVQPNAMYGALVLSQNF